MVNASFLTDEGALSWPVYTANRSVGVHIQPVVHMLPDPLRCGYASKRCENPRTVKKSGGLHRFCAYHRERANKNQWRVDNRRRVLRRLSQSKSESECECDSPRSTSTNTTTKAEVDTLVDLDDLSESSIEAFGSPDLLCESDAIILSAMLFSDEESESKAEPPAQHSQAGPVYYYPSNMVYEPTQYVMPATLFAPTTQALYQQTSLRAARRNRYAHI